MNHKVQQMCWRCKVVVEINQMLSVVDNMEKDIVTRLREFMDEEAKSCSMDFGCITPEYVYRMWGGMVSIEEIRTALETLKKDYRK